MYKANWSSDGQTAVTCGADRVLNYWDLRKSAKPCLQFKDATSCLLSCDFVCGDCFIVSTSITGDIDIHSINREKLAFHHETLPSIIAEHKENMKPVDGFTLDEAMEAKAARMPTNAIYTVTGVTNVPGDENVFLIGSEDADIQKVEIDGPGLRIRDKFCGHSMGIRSAVVSKDGGKLVSGCEDHSLRVWDYQTCKVEKLLSGHGDFVVSKPTHKAVIMLMYLILLIDWRYLPHAQRYCVCLLGSHYQGLERVNI